MPVRFVAEFMGLMAIVPGGTDGSVDVVAMNGRNAGVAGHEARLVVDARFVRNTPGEAGPDTYLALPDGRRMAVWNTSHTRVSIHRADARTASARVEYDDRPIADDLQIPASARPAAWQSLGWLADVSRAGGCAPTSSDCLVDLRHLSPHVHPQGSGCASPTDALIHLTTGRLVTGVPHSTFLQGAIWDFALEGDPKTATHTRALSDHATLEIEDADTVVIEIAPFSGGKGQTIHLKGSDGEPVRAAFASLPRPGHDEHAEAGTTRIEHFAAFYELLRRPPVDRRIPWLHETAATSGISSTECPPALARRR